MVFTYNTRKDPPRPECLITVRNPRDPDKSIVIENAIADTGSDITWIPQSKINELNLLIQSQVTVTTANSESQLPMYLVKIIINDLPIENIEVIANPNNVTLIGRDILNQYKSCFDGNHNQWQLLLSGNCNPNSSS